MKRLRERNEWKFFAVVTKADPTLALVWYVILVLRGVLPAAFAVATGVLISGAQQGEPLMEPLLFAGVTFILLQVLAPIHQSLGLKCHDIGYTQKCHDIGYTFSEFEIVWGYERSP